MAIEQECKARATKGEIKRANNGTLQAVVEFYIKAPQRLEGTTVLWFGSFTGGARVHTLRQLRTMGWGGDLQDLTGVRTKDVRLGVTTEERNGFEKLKAGWVNELSRTLPGTAVDAHELGALQAAIAGNADAPSADEYEERGTGNPDDF